MDHLVPVWAAAGICALQVSQICGHMLALFASIATNTDIGRGKQVERTNIFYNICRWPLFQQTYIPSATRALLTGALPTLNTVIVRTSRRLHEYCLASMNTELDILSYC